MFHLVEDWKECYKWWSVRIAAVVAIAPRLYANMEILQSYVDQTSFNYIMTVLGVLVIIGRMKKQ